MLIPTQRALFDIPTDVHYLNCAYMAPLMRSAAEAGERGVRLKSTPWLLGVDDFFAPGERVRGLFASVLGTTADHVALHPSVSYGLDTAAANLPLARGQHVLTLAEQFPSNVYPWRERVAQVGAEIVTAPRASDGWTPSVLERITPQTAIVAIPANHWTDGTTVDLVAVGEACRAVGASLALDLTQSLGAVPFDLDAVKPDVVVSAAYKWLLGPYSMAFTYFAPHLHDGAPIEHNWITRRSSDDFAQLVNYRDTYQPGARRFDVGERSNFALLPIAEAALTQLVAWGVDSIAETLALKTDALSEAAQAIGLEVLEPHAPHMLGLRFQGGLPPTLPARLRAKNIFVSVRGDAIRVSPHLYNDEADLMALITALKTARG